MLKGAMLVLLMTIFVGLSVIITVNTIRVICYLALLEAEHNLMLNLRSALNGP